MIKKIFAITALAFTVSLAGAPLVAAAVTTDEYCSTKDSDGNYPKECDYIPLTTIPGLTEGCQTSEANGYSTANCTPANPVALIKNIYGISIGIAAVLAVVMIIWAGVEYATTEAITGKSDAKEKWKGALIGLGLLLSSYLILRTINIELVNIDLGLGNPKIGGEPVSENGLKSLLNDAQNQAALSLETLRNRDNAVKRAKEALDNALRQGNPQAIETAQKNLDSAKTYQNLGQLDQTQALAAAVITKSLSEGDEAAAQRALDAARVGSQRTLDQITDPNIRSQAVNQAKLNDEVNRAVFGSARILHDLDAGTYPVWGDRGAREFNEMRGKFLRETAEAARQLNQTDPQAAATYRQRVLTELNRIDNQWLTNLKSCARGYDVRTGCKS